MMHRSTSLAYGKGEGYEAVTLPYDGNELSLLAIVPTAGNYSAFESALTGSKVLDILAGLQQKSVQLSFPKLKLESALSLKKSLNDLGMKAAFDNADLSGISTTEPLFISDVVHKTFLALDENGTEAAAATAVAVAGRSSIEEPTDPVKLDVDRPFLMAIVDHQTKTLVFLGRILEAKAE